MTENEREKLKAKLYMFDVLSDEITNAGTAIAKLQEYPRLDHYIRGNDIFLTTGVKGDWDNERVLLRNAVIQAFQDYRKNLLKLREAL